MKCFNCGNEISDNTIGICPNCSSVINATKQNFISYIGSPDSLAGYQKSYKLLLLKSIIEHIINHSNPVISSVITDIRDYYTSRIKRGLQADYDVDIRIANIESASDYDIFAVIKSQPYKVINEKGYLFLNRNAEGKLSFVFNEDISASMSESEWKKLLDIIDAKICLYFQRYDSSNTEFRQETATPAEKDSGESIIVNPDLSILEITNLSVRAKNVLMRNKLFTIGAVIEYIKDNDLLDLKNMGKKTCEEILSLLGNNNIQTSPPVDEDSIATLFAENSYRLFVNYCTQNGLTHLSDLEGLDFSVLLRSEPGFGVGKLDAIKKRYNEILQRSHSFVSNDQSDSVATVSMADTMPTINIDKSNEDLNVSCLRFVEISAKSIAIFFENGYSKIGQLSTITIGRLIRMFGHKGQEYFEKIKLFEKPLLEIATNLLNQQKTNREFDIFIDRANKKTLQEVADKHGLTRERVRQIESKFARQFSPLFIVLVKQQMAENNSFYISAQDVLEFFDDDDFDTVIMYTLKESPELEYLSFADLFVDKKAGDQNTSSKLYELSCDLIGDEGIDFFESLPQIEEMLNDSGLDYISPDDYLNYLFEINACFYGDYVFLRKQPYVKLCLLIIKEHFKDGIYLYSDEDINLLRQYLRSEFGDIELPEKNRAISARLSDFLITCDRGKAKLIDYISFDQSVIEEIKRYIDSSPLKSLYFTEIFNEFEGVLAFTSDIVNYHGLHGILAYLYHDEYDFSRDCITKKNSAATSLSLAERIDLYIKEKGHAINRAEIRNLIGGMSDIMLINAINSSQTLLQWDYNSYNSMANIVISEDERQLLCDMLEDIFQCFNGYCSDRLIYEKTKKELPGFIDCNHIENSTNLYYVLQKLLATEYQFSRPHICKNDIVSSMTTKNIALYLLGTTKIISRKEFMKISKSVLWSETTADMIFSELEKDYIRISEDTYILAEDFCICEDDLELIKHHIHSILNSTGYISMIGFSEFEDFPRIHYEWNTFLLISIIRIYELGVRVISPAIKDRRYNKEIIVGDDSEFYKLDDIVYYLLIKNNIRVIEESNLLPFLVVHHLIAKIIPKELYDSQKLNYADGYFRI